MPESKEELNNTRQQWIDAFWRAFALGLAICIIGRIVYVAIE